MTSEITQISNLLKHERYHRDTAQWDLCRAAYHPDADQTYIDVSWFRGTIDAFLTQSAKIHPGGINVIHSSFDPVDIKIVGTRATSEAFCLITSNITIAGSDYELASYMRLISRLHKLKLSGLDSDSLSDSGAVWRIVRLEAIYVRDRLVSAFPGADSGSQLVLGGACMYPRAYRNMAFVMLNRGLAPRVDLPHEDDQVSVRRVLDGGAAFLNGKNDGV
ncbi:hypothetical protein BJX66DRAFT_343490 [Aspergillus keveii]|uniref:SnoaL-like domain-containing protein n=1 Tax=Aspergillus keveii TaxID=714993 RepID=A0ABR4FNZ5_9EURO